jgi:hypothetical protein
MPLLGLPIVGDTMTNPNPGPLPAAAAPHVPINGGAVVHQATAGNAVWNVNTLQVANVPPDNFRFIPAVPNTVSYCVVPGVGGVNPVYVISDQYGGCEYHELYNAALNALAFLHVYRGGGIITPYNLNAGWVRRSVKRSAVIAQTYGMAGSNWSMSRIDRSVVPPAVTSTFIHLNNALLVTGVDAGNTPYPAAACVIL